MLNGISVKALAVATLASVCCANEAADLRNAVDSKLQEKVDIRNEREGLLNQLHTFSENRKVKKTNLDAKEQHVLYSYRDYFTKEVQCDGLDYERSLLDGI